jgi:transposase
VPAACRQARVSEGTFYYWKPRFEAGGYEALVEFASHAPKEPHRIEADIEQAIINLRQQNPTWGKRRIADEMAKANDWVPLVSPNTVKRILQAAGLWQKPEPGVKKKGRSIN